MLYLKINSFRQFTWAIFGPFNCIDLSSANATEAFGFNMHGMSSLHQTLFFSSNFAANIFYYNSLRLTGSLECTTEIIKFE